jgi:hypothetical protein
MAPCDRVTFSVPYPQWALFQQEARRHGAALEPAYGEKVDCIATIESSKTIAFFDDLFDQSAGTLTGEITGNAYRPVEEHA